MTNTNEELITKALEAARFYGETDSGPLLRELADRIEHLSAELEKSDSAFSKVYAENGRLHMALLDARSRMKLEIMSAVHGIPSWGTSPADNHFDLPGEPDKSFVMDVIREVKA